MEKSFAILEIGSNNTKTHVYALDNLVYEDNVTIEFKKNYKREGKINEGDLTKLYGVIEKALEYTKNVHIYGCSLFRSLTSEELEAIDRILKENYGLKIEVVSQKDEAMYTAIGCYKNIDYDGKLCVFIGGGGSIEMIFVSSGVVVDEKYYNFGVVDVTNEYPSLKDDIPECTYLEVYDYVSGLIGSLGCEADTLILAGGDHLYWYENAGYELDKNTLYESESQKYMLGVEKSDLYDRDMMKKSLDEIRNNSDNPLWFDGARAMKVITNVISHKIGAKYIVPTKINMEDGIKAALTKGENLD